MKAHAWFSVTLLSMLSAGVALAESQPSSWIDHPSTWEILLGIVLLAAGSSAGRLLSDRPAALSWGRALGALLVSASGALMVGFVGLFWHQNPFVLWALALTVGLLTPSEVHWLAMLVIARALRIARDLVEADHDRPRP